MFFKPWKHIIQRCIYKCLILLCASFKFLQDILFNFTWWERVWKTKRLMKSLTMGTIRPPEKMIPATSERQFAKYCCKVSLRPNPTILLFLCSWMSQPHFGISVRMKLTSPKMGSWSPPGLPKIQSSSSRVKTPCIDVFFISMERSWSVDAQIDLACAIWTSAAQVMGKRRVGSQTKSRNH